MWDGESGQTNIGKHLINLSPADAKLIHCTPYGAGAKAREFEENKVKKMFLKGFI